MPRSTAATTSKSRMPDLDDKEKRAIRRYLRHRIRVCEGTIKKMESVPKNARPESYSNNILYYNHCLAAFKFALSRLDVKGGKAPKDA